MKLMWEGFITWISESNEQKSVLGLGSQFKKVNCRLSTCKNMVRNEEENESDSEEEHNSEEESGNFVLLIFGSCFFVLFTGCFWAKKKVRRYVQEK